MSIHELGLGHTIRNHNFYGKLAYHLTLTSPVIDTRLIPQISASDLDLWSDNGSKMEFLEPLGLYPPRFTIRYIHNGIGTRNSNPYTQTHNPLQYSTFKFKINFIVFCLHTARLPPLSYPLTFRVHSEEATTSSVAVIHFSGVTEVTMEIPLLKSRTSVSTTNPSECTMHGGEYT